MAFAIITPDGSPLADLDGRMITLATKAEAVTFLRSDEHVEQVEDDQTSQTEPD